MGMSLVKCTCGEVIDAESINNHCPACGGVNRELFVSDVLRVWEGIKMEQLEEGHPGFVKKIIQRDKVSALGKEAREIQIYDRGDPSVTTKYHRVEELENGEWVVKHLESITYPAKHRPRA